MHRCPRCSSLELSSSTGIISAPANIGDAEFPIIFVGTPKPFAKGLQSSIAREKLASTTMLEAEGIRGDEVADKRHHGGPDRAVLVVSRQTYKRFTIADQPGLLGENLSVKGFTEEQVMIGDHFLLGDAVLEVNQPRSPCFKLDIVTHIRGFAKELQDLGCAGWFLRVIRSGNIQEDSRFELLSRPSNAITVAEANCLYYHQSRDRDAWDVLMSQSALSTAWRQRIQRRMQTDTVEPWDKRLQGP